MQKGTNNVGGVVGGVDAKAGEGGSNDYLLR